MITTIRIKKEIELNYIQVNSHVRYWEDGSINGVPDNVDDPEMPCTEYRSEFEEYRWCPVINIDTGKIMGWPKGVKAKIHYKVCDEFTCNIIDSNNYPYVEYDGYVPRFMSPMEENYGDYIIMSIDDNGYIEGWNINLVEKFIKEYNE